MNARGEWGVLVGSGWGSGGTMVEMSLASHLLAGQRLSGEALCHSHFVDEETEPGEGEVSHSRTL